MKNIFKDSTKGIFTKRDYQRLFFLGALLGAVIFIAIYGVKIINPNYVAWIYYGDNDLKQHYVGWSHFRNCSWRFPIGLVDTLSYPTSVSVIYTDSIPIVAVFFKLFSNALPVDFQYFGLVGILSFALSGGTSAVLLKRFINNPYIALMTTPLFTLSFPIIQRMYYHTALAAHWIIFLALIIWVYDSFDEKIWKSVTIWAFMGFLCVSVHSYYLAIVGMILFADRINYLLVHKNAFKKSFIKALFPMFSFCIAGVVSLYIYGGLYGENSPVGYGLGTFGSNLNTFINPMDYGRLLPDLKVSNYFQYEGMGYLGAGIIALSFFVDVILIKNRKELFKNINDRNKALLISGAVLFIISFLSATLPAIALGNLFVFQIPYPKVIFNLLSIFRSNGRFIWTAMYLLMLAITVLAVKFLENKRNVLLIVLAAVLLVQGIDLSKMIAEKHNFYTGEYEYKTMWDDSKYKKLLRGKSSFVFLYNDSDLNMDTAFFAYRHNMKQNNFYFARDIDKEVTKTINNYLDELSNKLVRDDTVYIMKEEDFEANREFLEGLNLNIEYLDGFVAFSN